MQMSMSATAKDKTPYASATVLIQKDLSTAGAHEEAMVIR
jgi:hypothetical protein